MSELAANSQITETFTIQTADAATMVINTSVTSVITDANAANNSDQSILKVSAEEPASSSSGGGSLSVWFFFSMLLLVALTTTARRKAAVQRIAVAKQQ